jgi:hypothetical protein
MNNKRKRKKKEKAGQKAITKNKAVSVKKIN